MEKEERRTRVPVTIKNGVQKLAKKHSRNKQMQDIKRSMGGAYHSTGKTYNEDFMNNQLLSGPVKTLSREEIAELEAQYSKGETHE